MMRRHYPGVGSETESKEASGVLPLQGTRTHERGDKKKDEVFVTTVVIKRYYRCLLPWPTEPHARMHVCTHRTRKQQGCLVNYANLADSRMQLPVDMVCCTGNAHDEGRSDLSGGMLATQRAGEGKGREEGAKFLFFMLIHGYTCTDVRVYVRVRVGWLRIGRM